MPIVTREMRRRSGMPLEMPASRHRISRRCPVESGVPGDEVPAESPSRGGNPDVGERQDDGTQSNFESIGLESMFDDANRELSSQQQDIRSETSSEWKTESSRTKQTSTAKSSHLRRKLKAEEEWAALQKQINDVRRKELQLEKQDLQNKQDLARLRQEAEEAESQELSDEDVNEARSQNQLFPNTSEDMDKNEAVANWVKDTSVESSPLDALTQALTNAFQNIIPQSVQASTSGTDMKKFLARQSTGKDLPSFSGDPEDWQFFYTTVTRSSKMCGYSEEENIARLQKCLKGKAKEAVQAMLVSTCSFDEIVGTLKKRFGRPQIIIKSLVEKARRAAAPQEEDPESIMDFAIVVKNLCSSAESLKQSQYLSNPQLMEELMLKLPAHMRMEWGRYTLRLEEEDISLKDLSRFLDEAATVASRITASVCKLETSEFSGKKKGPEKKQQAYVVNEEKFACILECKHRHDLAACQKFKNMTTRDRWNLVKASKLCFMCLQTGHSRTACPLNRKCELNGCEKFHHRLLHFEPKKDNEARNVKIDLDRTVPKDGPGFSGNVQRYPYDDVLMRVLPVRLSGPNGTCEVNAFFDEGSSVSMIDEDLAAQLGLKGKKKPLNLSWINGNSNADFNSTSVSMKIAGVSSRDSRSTAFRICDVRTVKNLYLPAQPLENYKMRKNWTHLNHVPFSSIGSERPKILLGQDNITLTVPREVVEGSENAPIATLTKLGWVVHGKTTSGKRESEHVSFAAFQESQDDELHELVKDQFRLDSLGIMSHQKLPKSKEDERAETLMEEYSRRKEDHWETGLLWKEDGITLPNSKPAAFRRLSLLEKQMDKDPKFAELYCNKIDEYVDKGFCHKLSPSELEQESEKTWYLPHFGTTNPNKPGKLRLVFDCAAKVNGISLNDALLQGPDLMTPLIDVMGRFRQKEVGFSGDIRDMFHMVRMRQEDLPSLRFLWRGRDRNNPPDVWTMNVMVFGAVTSPYQAQWIKNRNGEECRAVYGDTVNAIVDNHYVDDYLDSTSTEVQACKKINDIKDVHKQGGFEIRNWLCSSNAVLQEVAPEELQRTSSLELTGDEKLERVLGLYWNPKEDCFRFKMRFRTVDEVIVRGDKVPTKREILKLVMCLFDPLGFLAHLTVRAKILLQDIWRLGIGWDDEIPASVNIKWKQFLEQLHGILQVSVPRCYAPFISTANDIQLHVFCDASEQAYCAVAYLRVSMNGRGDALERVFTNIVIAKTRVSPLRPVSIPRLELQAALVGSRLVSQVKKSHDLKLSSVHMWTDSKTTLCWIRARDPRSFKPYVSHRIGEIQEHTNVSMWKWVPTKENVADEGTRDACPIDMTPSSRWFKGPSFLELDEENWPKESQQESTLSQEVLEIRRTSAFASSNVEYLPDIRRFSDWMKLLRVTGWCVRFVRNFVAKHRKSLNWKATYGPLQCSEVKIAEQLWIKKVQRDCYGSELNTLQGAKIVDRVSKLSKLSPILMDGIIRVDSRIKKSPDVSQNARMPVILDPKHQWTRLLIAFYHKAARHSGMETVFNELRQRYWILDMRTAIRSVWKRCQQCRLEKAKPVNPQMAPLPEIRVTRCARPFTNVGVDYFGPVEVVYLRRSLKRWGVIFTCLSTRAIHLEVAHSLSTDSFIMALERFISRRGEPEVMWSDNGTNFKGAENELKKSLQEMDKEKIVDKLTRRGITWKFIPPSAPHMGGAWERLVRCVKVSLNSVMKNQRLSDEVLLTVLAEAEATVNSRPLTFVSSDKDDVEALTPNCFLMGTTSVKQPPGVFEEADLSLRKKWRIAEMLAEHFWRRWTKEYLPTLSLRKKWQTKTEDLKLGDLVFVADSNLPRNNWPKGLVVATFPGKDGHVRVVDVKTANGLLRRPVVKLYRIKVDEDLE